jgi:hypothetical protein
LITTNSTGVDVPYNTFETLCLRTSIGTAWCGALIEVASNEKFWGITIALLGTLAAWWLAILRNRREAARALREDVESTQRLKWAQEEHEIRMSLMQRNELLELDDLRG